MTLVKKYKQVLATLLTMSLTVCAIPTGIVEISASAENQSDEISSMEEVETYSEENGIEISDGLVPEASESGEGESEGEEHTAGETGFFGGEQTGNTMEADSSNDNETGFFSGAEDNGQVTEITSEVSEEQEGEDLFSDDTQKEETDLQENGQASVQAEATGVLRLNQLKHYKEKESVMSIRSNEDLILLSNCDPKEIQGITIEFSSSGDIDITQPIAANTDLSEWLSTVATSAADETSVQEAASADENIDVQEETVQQDEAAANSLEGNIVIEDEMQAEAAAETTEEDLNNNTEEIVDATMMSDSAEGEQGMTVQDTITAGVEYKYKGIGSADYPFQGTIKGVVPANFKVGYSFFGGLSSKAVISMNGGNILSLTWCGDGTVPMLAGTYQFDETKDVGHMLPAIKITGDSSGVLGSLIGTIKEVENVKNQTLHIEKDIVTYTDGVKVNVVPVSGNAGLICNTLESGNLHIGNYAFPSESNEIKITSANQNAGGVIGEMKKNTKLELDSTIKFEGVTITATTGNAGGIVGIVEKPDAEETAASISVKAALNFTNVTINGSTAAGGLVGSLGEKAKFETTVNAVIEFSKPVIKVTAGTGTAGGLMGRMKEHSEIVTAENAGITIDSPQITITSDGTKTVNGAAGGIAGKADNVTFNSVKSDIEVSTPNVGGKSWTHVGGFVGDYTLNADIVDTNQSFPQYIKIINPTVWADGAWGLGGGNSGGYFGRLNLQGGLCYVIGSEDNTTAKTEFNAKYKQDGGRSQGYGAIAGQLTSTAKESALVLQNLEVNSVYTTGETRPMYHGGLIGRIGDNDQENVTYLEVNNVAVNITNPHARSLFGGISAYLTKNSIMKVYNVKIDTRNSNDSSLWEGGGILGHAGEGSVLELSGCTDLTNVNFQGRSNGIVGQLVKENECGLVYAKGDGNGNGWTYKRSSFTKASAFINDIGTYGQIIRLKSSEDSSSTGGLSYNLIQITNEHDVVLKNPAVAWSNIKEISLSSADDFALLSIAWNSRGYFSANKAVINTKNYGSLFKSNITITSDINLTGTGIYGLTRDNSKELAYSGVFSASNGATLTLAIGETFGFQESSLATDDKEGCGRVYAYNSYHNYQGIFAIFAGEIKNIKIAGAIHVSNAGNEMTVGGVAAGEAGGNQVITVNNVTTSENIVAYINGSAGMIVGGFFGSGIATNEQATLQIENGTKAGAKIHLKSAGGNTNDTKIYAGGVIGRVENSYFKLACNDLTVTGEITSDVQKYAYVGGLIGIINNSGSEATANHWMEIRKLEFNGFKINASKASEVCGGLLGSIWSHVGVYFMGERNGNDGTDTKLKITDAAINAPNAKSVGGLAYRSSGIWEIRAYGINMEKFTINAREDIGLLVCHGEKAYETINNTSTELGALFLDTTEYWDDGEKFSYKIGKDVNISSTKTGAFDEFVAYTAASATTISNNGVNGVISIATQLQTSGTTSVPVGVDKEKCTTYQNRTAYGSSHETNSCSRYYYDLEQCLAEAQKNSAKNNGRIDTPQELVLWSTHRYAAANIKEYLTRYENTSPQIKINDVVNDVSMIGSDSSTTHASLDMQTYSYYPINLDGGITVQYADIKFYNKEIETCESKETNKLTSASDVASQSQHYTMHCGLFLNHVNGKNEKTEVSLQEVSFSGTVGKVNYGNSSGVLFSGSVNGSKKENTVYQVTVEIQDVTFKNLAVNDCGNDYAPLFINSIGSYTNLDVNGVTHEEYTLGTAAASSLIGNVGSDSGTQINLSFLNILLPDKSAEEAGGIFTHATLLESFRHDGSSSVATYNFYYENDYKEDKYDHHKVTYGREISESTEYLGQQKWYYDEDKHGKEEGVVKDVKNDFSISFSSYLPYVYVSYSGLYHEIKVNQRVADIVNGCGTYGHPYKITSESEMTIISEYLATGKARKDWRVTITKNQTEFCENSARDISYQYNGTSWDPVEKEENEWKVISGTPLDNDVMLQYMLNAFYDLKGEKLEDRSDSYQMKLTNFGGFGNSFRPFRGVLTSTNTSGTTLILEGSGTCSGLIPYSYGSVIRNLTIVYGGTGTESVTEQKTLTYNGDKTSSYYQDVCFGGVIGCILGGDNIIDNVTVRIAENWLKIEGEKKHLIPVGGYVGSVCGGGVIFRGMESAENNKNAKTGLTDAMIAENNVSVVANAYKSMYVNPYVGRVLDGFAFNESTVGMENTDKNYKINTLTTHTDPCISVDETTVTETTVAVQDRQGLLILSAVVNSGAASNGISNAYSNTANAANSKTTTYKFGGKYGKVRRASYNHIGIGQKDEEVELSLTDDQNMVASENPPYLLAKYGNGSCFNLGGDQNVNIILTKDGYDMTIYGSGYQGISARYVSNAILQGDSAKAKGIVPQLLGFNGNESSLTLDTQVKEYADDDFHAAAVGGVYNLLRIETKKTCTIQKLALQGKKDAKGVVSGGVSLQYYDAAGNQVDSATEYTFKNNVDVGGFAGTTSSISAIASRSSASVNFSNVELKNMNIVGSVNAGGLIGSSGREAPSTKPINYRPYDIALLLQPELNNRSSIGISIIDSKYDGITIDAFNAVGGFVGYLDNNDTEIESTLVTNNEITVGNGSKIGTNKAAIYAGGVFGYIKTKIKVNAKATGKAVLQDIQITAKPSTSDSGWAGGLIGMIDGKEYQINRVLFKGTKADKAAITTPKGKGMGTGGIVGYAKGSGNENKFTECNLEKGTINTVNHATASDKDRSQGAGGIVGIISHGVVTFENCSITSSKIYGAIAGGIAGNVKIKTSFTSCAVTGSSDSDKTEVKGYCCAGGIFGIFNNKNTVSIKKSNVRFLDVTGQAWGVGAFGGDSDNNNTGALYIFDCAAQNANVVGGKQTWNKVGGIIGNLRGNFAASNILIANVTFDGPSKTGVLFGDVRSNAVEYINIAGISLQGINPDIKLYKVDGTDNISSKSYFAFADYSGSALNAEQVGNTNLLQVPLGETGDKIMPANELSEPYVVTSPKSSLCVNTKATATGESTALSLYGDGVSWDADTDTFGVLAENIFKDNLPEAEANGHYKYKKTNVSSFDFTKAISAYNANQPIKSSLDFPVLQVSDGDTTTVMDYLNIITNGGFSEANKLNSDENKHVEASTAVYVYDAEKGYFIRDTKENAALQVKTENNKISFVTTTDYDNEKNRFTLLTVTFTEKDESNQEHNYNIMVPVIVRRMLEMDFTATLSYGTNFRSSDYTGTSHVLEGFGSSISGYLTYTYNSKKGTFADYGWESYIEAGGNVAEPMDKALYFALGRDVYLPKGTQLSLVDCLDDRVYYYTVTGTENNKISLKSFESSDGVKYQAPSLAELMKVTVEENGIFVKVESDGRLAGTEPSANETHPAPTVRIKNAKGEYEYYRLAEEGEISEKKYKMKIPEGALNSGTKSSISENYYLVITVPKNSGNVTLNGSLQTEITSEIPHEIYYLKKDGTVDSHNNTASTYVISKGYTHTLDEQNIVDLTKKVSVDDSKVKVDVVDTIAFPTDQIYNEYDQLYLRFVGGLQKTVNNVSQAVMFPSGTQGTANFYVYRENGTAKTYYQYNGNGWSEAAGNTETVAVSYSWISDGGNMELPLMKVEGDKKQMISLREVRDLVKAAGIQDSARNSTFYVEVRMEARISETGLDVIPESKPENGQPTDFTKLTYYSQLSTEAQSLSYSTNRATKLQTQTAYYREEPAGAKLTYEANDISQLGINLLDLQNLDDATKKYSQISTTAYYNLSDVKNLDDALKNSSGIKFTLSLQPKNTDTNQSKETYQTSTADAADYLDIELESKAPDKEDPTKEITPVVDYKDSTWSWTVPQIAYWKDGNINNNSSVFKGNVLSQRILLKVRVDNVEDSQLNHYYSNYRVVVTAEILNSAGTGTIEPQQNADIIYTLAKIAPEFILPSVKQ